MRALVSVSDKTNLVEFVSELVNLGYEIISTGGTKKALDNAGIKTMSISEITHFPEIMDGRVKTLHPNVHGALLCVRDNEEHLKALKDNHIDFIDLVCVNLYPFKETVQKPGVSHDEIIENIDIGGPSMLRSASKNYRYIPVVCDPADYDKVLEELRNGGTTLETRLSLAAKVFRHTAAYDAMIAEYLTKKEGLQYPEKLTMTYDLVSPLRYGENPHQSAAFYKGMTSSYSLTNATFLHGKELSYNNIQDANACIEVLKEFDKPTVVAMKHMNPCGVGTADDINTAWDRAYDADPISIFGGIIAINRNVDLALAEKMHALFLEVIIAPSYDADALEVLCKKKNLRILELDTTLPISNKPKQVSVLDGLLLQDYDNKEITAEDLTCVTEAKPTAEDIENLLNAFKIVKHVKSNAIVLYKNNQTVGIGAGQMNRVGSLKIAIEQAGEEKCKDSYIGSDAFFPMPDCVQMAAEHGIRAIIQPGGSIRDQDSIDECNKHGIIMVFTGVRHFKH